MRKPIAVAAITGALVVGGGIGAVLFGPTVVGAQTTSTTTPSGDTAHCQHDAAQPANL
jgi:hypothetical protein